MLNTDTVAAMLVSGIATGPASLAVETANGLPEGETKKKLLRLAERQLENLYLMETEGEDEHLEEDELSLIHI